MPTKDIVCIPALLFVCKNIITVGAWNILRDLKGDWHIATFIRKDRYTAELLEEEDFAPDFTLMLTNDIETLKFMGEKSGRDIDKKAWYKRKLAIGRLYPKNRYYECEGDSVTLIGDHYMLMGKITKVEGEPVLVVQPKIDEYLEVDL
jgi:flavin reductase (DIM6/NTAB) family NADH-FMN oxidoreductase RutF